MTGDSLGRWPDGRRAAISITMDNMGEAAELLRGTWPEDRTIGLHHSVTRALPTMLRILEEYGIRTTYFVEGWNTDHYPEAIRAVRQAGHEVAFHGWQHEPWSSLSPETERELFERSLRGFAKLNLNLWGFRPPGGVLTESTTRLLSEFDFTFCSPAGTYAALDDETVYLPFDWKGIDAYYYSEGFAGLRQAKGDNAEPLSPSVLQGKMLELIEQRVDTCGYTALLFHPFLEEDGDRIVAMRTVLERVSADDRIWCAPGKEIAAWVRENQPLFGDDPEFDRTSWTR